MNNPYKIYFCSILLTVLLFSVSSFAALGDLGDLPESNNETSQNTDYQSDTEHGSGDTSSPDAVFSNSGKEAIEQKPKTTRTNRKPVVKRIMQNLPAAKEIAAPLWCLVAIIFPIALIFCKIAIVMWVSISKVDKVDRARTVCSRAPVFSFISGLITFIVLIFLAQVLGKAFEATKNGLPIIIIFLLLGYFMYRMFIGFAAIFQNAGLRMRKDNVLLNEAEPDYLDTLKGGLVIGLAMLIPIAGWIAGLYLGFVALGASMLSIWTRKK